MTRETIKTNLLMQSFGLDDIYCMKFKNNLKESINRARKMENLMKKLVLLFTLAALLSCNDDLEASVTPTKSEESISRTLPCYILKRRIINR